MYYVQSDPNVLCPYKIHNAYFIDENRTLTIQFNTVTKL